MGVKYPQTVTTWERAWERFTPFLDFPPMLRRVIYTTNSIESLNYQLRKVSKNRGHFPSDEAVVKLLWLAICDTCGQTSPRTRQGERTATIQAQGQGQTRRRTDHHRLEQGPGPARHRLPRPNQPLPIDPAYTENWTGLSTAVERSTAGTPLLDVTVEWEYTTVPCSATRRFACVSDQDEYNELLADTPATAAWLLQNRPGVDAASRSSYELLELTVDGRSQTIRRSTRKTGQTYSVDLDEDAVQGQPVRIRQVIRTVVPRWGHRLFFEVAQPTRDLSVHLDYSDTTIADLRVSDTVATAQAARVTRMPDAVPSKAVTVEASGWLMPHSGFAFTWALQDELPQTTQSEAATARRAG